MLVQVNTNHSVHGTQDLAQYVESELTQKLERFADQITRIEVHMNDTNAGKSGPDDKRCQIEARIAGMNAVSVTHTAEDLDLAIHGAIDKLRKLLTKTFDQRNDHHVRESDLPQLAPTDLE